MGRSSSSWRRSTSCGSARRPGTRGLDVEPFDKELAEHVHAARVHEDFMSGVRSGVNGTPSFYINGARHDDSCDIETLLSALERAATSERETR